MSDINNSVDLVGEFKQIWIDMDNDMDNGKKLGFNLIGRDLFTEIKNQIFNPYKKYSKHQRLNRYYIKLISKKLDMKLSPKHNHIRKVKNFVIPI